MPQRSETTLRFAQDDVVVLAVQNQQRRHAFELVEELVRKAAVPLGDGIDGDGLRAEARATEAPSEV